MTMIVLRRSAVVASLIGGAMLATAGNPVSVPAQVGGGPQVVPYQDLDARVSPYKHELREGFLGAQVPPRYADPGYDPVPGQYVPRTAYTLPIPEQFVEERGELAGYEYFTLADGRIVLVDPATGAVASVID